MLDITTYPQTQRGYFAFELHQQMRKNTDIWFITGDLGRGAFDEIFRDYPDRSLNMGAAETAMMDIAVGLALSGKKPFVYSITTFLLYRPFEVIRNYINHEKIPVMLVGNGIDKDYHEDGFSHWSEDAKATLDLFPNIQQYWPKDRFHVPGIVQEMLQSNKPSFIGLSKKLS